MPLHLFPSSDCCVDCEKLKAGAPATFRLIYRLFFNEFLKAAKVKLAEKEEARNLVNHCFVRAWYRSNEYSTLEGLLGWLHYTVRRECEACNSSINYRSGAHMNIMNKILSGNSFSETDPGLRCITSITDLQLESAKKIFKWFYARGMTSTEIADGLSLNDKYTQAQLELAFRILHYILIGNI